MAPTKFFSLYYIPHFSHIIIAIIFDKKLKKLFKARNNHKTQPISLIPWQEIGANLEEHNIPQKATNISIFFFLISIMSMPLYAIGI